MKTIICLMGPTASGKTLLALELVQYFPCDIISVDSAMVYRGMDIGTAKPNAEELAQVPHRLVNIRDPADSYSVGQFCVDVPAAIQEIHTQGRIPLLVGGTMMYFHSLQQGLASLPAADLNLRKILDELCERLGLATMYIQLKRIDPLAAKQIASQDWRRIQRALEIYYLTGETLTHLKTQRRPKLLPYSILNLVLSPTDRPLLRDRIRSRFLNMLKQGFVEEVDVLFQRPDLQATMPALQAVGYQQIWSYLEGKINQEEMREKAMTASCQLAKRQLTWLRRWENAHWFESSSDFLVLLSKVRSFIESKL